MTAEKKKKIQWLAINVILALLESYLCYVLMFRRGTGFDLEHLLRYANYANFCVFVSSWILVIGCIVDFVTAKERAYYGFRLFRYMAVSAASVTFVVAVFLALPMTGFDFRPYLEDVNLLECIVCPILAYISFTRYGGYTDFDKKEVVIATLPGAVYHISIVTLNRFGIMDGPYKFQMADIQSPGVTLFWAVVIIGGTYIVSNALLIVAKAHGPRGIRRTIVEKRARNRTKL